LLAVLVQQTPQQPIPHLGEPSVLVGRWVPCGDIVGGQQVCDFVLPGDRNVKVLTRPQLEIHAEK